jgi:hypothetical protein
MPECSAVQDERGPVYFDTLPSRGVLLHLGPQYKSGAMGATPKWAPNAKHFDPDWYRRRGADPAANPHVIRTCINAIR